MDIRRIALATLVPAGLLLDVMKEFTPPGSKAQEEAKEETSPATEEAPPDLDGAQ
jgi:hypothetical protein